MGRAKALFIQTLELFNQLLAHEFNIHRDIDHLLTSAGNDGLMVIAAKLIPFFIAAGLGYVFKTKHNTYPNVGYFFPQC